MADRNNNRLFGSWEVPTCRSIRSDYLDDLLFILVLVSSNYVGKFDTF